MLAPMVDPMDKARRNPKRNMMCTLTCFSTAVLLIGAALSYAEGDKNTVRRKDNLRRIPHQLCLMSGKYNDAIYPRGIS